MSKTYSYNNFNVTTVDIKTVFHNRGVLQAPLPNQVPLPQSPGGASGNIIASRVLAGNHIDICKPSAAYKNAKNINAIHDNHAYVYVSGYRWKEYRAVTSTSAIDPAKHASTYFLSNSGGGATLTLDLNDVGILPGMVFGFAATGAGDLVINLSNGSIINPSTGAIGTSIAVPQYGFAVLRIIGSAAAAGGVNEVVTLTEGTNITAGSYTLTFGGQTTAAIQWNATAAQVQAALEALSTIGVGNILVTGMAGGLTAAPATLTFVNALGNQNVGPVTSNQAGLTGTFTIAVPTTGVTSAKAFIEDASGIIVS